MYYGITQLIGEEESFVREVIFVTPPEATKSVLPIFPPRPSIFMCSYVILPSLSNQKFQHPFGGTFFFLFFFWFSNNLNGSQIVKCRESIIYAPNFKTSSTFFTQVAQISSGSRFSSGGFIMSSIGEKIEEWALERFSSNAEKGREGFEAILRNFRIDDLSKVNVEGVKIESES
jgi:hypothetical protein